MKKLVFSIVCLSLACMGSTALAGPSQPDYQVSHLYAHSYEYDLTQIYIDWGVRNIGNATGGSSWTRLVFDGVRTTNVYISSGIIPQSTYGTTTWVDRDMVCDGTEGVHYIHMYADIYNNVAESNEVNNEAEITFSCNSDLITTHLSAETWSLDPSYVKINYQVNNIGIVPAGASTYVVTLPSSTVSQYSANPVNPGSGYGSFMLVKKGVVCDGSTENVTLYGLADGLYDIEELIETNNGASAVYNCGS